MILNTGSRTDIPAFYSDWFYERVKAGYVLVQSPYAPHQLTRYQLDPEVIDGLVFCTKDPGPMLDRFSLLADFPMFWSVTITPYGKEIEPYVPPKEQVIRSFEQLSGLVGRERVSWRYDPVLLHGPYTIQHHIRQFGQMAQVLSDYTDQCVVSFIDLYEKTKRNYPGIRSVTKREQEQLIDAFSKIAKEAGLQIHLCCEDAGLVRENVDADGCLYCYADHDRAAVLRNWRAHDPASPLLIGKVTEEDVIRRAVQKSWRDGQMELSDFL